MFPVSPDGMAIRGLATVGSRRGAPPGGRPTVTMPQELSSPYDYLPQPMPPPLPSGPGRRVILIITLLMTMMVTLGGAAAVGLLVAAGWSSVTVVAAAVVAPVTSGESPEPQVLDRPAGAAILTDPVITTAKLPYRTAGEWCSLLTPADIRAVIGFDQRGDPDTTLLCTHYFGTGAGFLFVSDIPANAGTARTVRGNSAILYQSEPTSCEVSVALNHSGGMLDIDVRGVYSPRVPPCAAVIDLAGRAFDRLPPA